MNGVAIRPLSDVAVWAFMVAVAGLVLLAPAIWNGFPLLQYDTGGYLARWYEGYLVPSRPGAYGLLLAASAPLNFWPVLSGASGADGLGACPSTALPWLWRATVRASRDREPAFGCHVASVAHGYFAHRHLCGS